MLGRRKSYADRRADSFEGLVQRIRLVVPATLRGGECEAGPYLPSNPPLRCAFQFNGQNGSDDSFPIEYVLRLMRDWADVPCNPYLRVQNTGVSVLFQGFFSRPAGAPGGTITAEQNNVILQSTEATGLALGDLDEIKARVGLDPRPMMASMWIHCFVRMPRVQLAFRFMGPEDAGRTRRILCRAAEHALARRHRTQRAEVEVEAAGPALPPALPAAPDAATGAAPARGWWRAPSLARQQRAVPPALLVAAGLVLGAALYWLVGLAR
ncbi:nuclear egress membrane protein [Cercopithecine alphaherpesvirus 2]|uniref:Type II membrane-associated phosphoprotein n=1 Tax=Cercopithecine alphaherpesvirus 2 TaxID=10317 RepID=Q5Y0R8_9ALPH|nr:nuclear egress membrane protein [Cercopithecine alphaherpesvirus 2]AAU88100.1 type II membrane-associated phosphoprotein [Cercopithecine alphaherpesvirus 2]